MPPDRKRAAGVKHDAATLTALLLQCLPRTYRIAAALSGDLDRAAQISQRILRQSLRVHQTWQSQTDPLRWFVHHTVLAAREFDKREFHAQTDPLLALSSDPALATLFRTLRFLPMQQREAFLLHHGEGLEIRQVATAMDCSTAAAANHLVAATRALEPIASNRLSEFTAALPTLLVRLVPPGDTMDEQIRREVRRHRWTRWVRFW